MRRILFILILIFYFPYAKAQDTDIDVLHYKFHIAVSDDNDSIHGAAIIKFIIKEKKPDIRFDLASLNKQGKGMLTTVVGYRIDYSVTEDFIHENNKLIVPCRLNKGDTAEIVINYKGIPSDGLIISKNKYGRRTFFADNWPNRGHNWLPCIDHPADKASVEFLVVAPQHYRVIANGIQVEETRLPDNFKETHWKEETPISTKVMVIGVAEFAVDTSGYVNDSIPVYSWVYPEDKDKGFYDYALAKDILPFFIGKVGPYGYKKLANVQSKTIFGGLENANTIFYSENSVKGDRSSEALLTHEIAHQWFGNMATEKSFGHLWLSEGFATYFTILYFENKYGKDTAVKMLKEDRDQVIAFSKKNNKTVVDTAEINYMNLLNENSYQKGSWMLHMLRSELGDSVFWQSIRKYYARYAGAVAGTQDLQRIFEEVSGKNLRQFFRQWLFTPGQPDVGISWEYDNVAGRLEVIISQRQKELFIFPLELRIQLASGKVLHKTIEVSGKSRSFEIYTKEKVTRVIPDPDTKLLFELNSRN